MPGTRSAVFALIIAAAASGALAGGPRAALAAAPSTITVVSGGWVRLPLSGLGRVETSSAENAIAWAGPDAVTVYGVRPGRAVLLLTYPDSIEARPIQVLAPPPAQALSLDGDASCGGPVQVRADASHLALDASDVSLDWSPGNWRLAWTPADVRLSASSALVTPLVPLGVPVSPGIEAEWRPGWELMASPTVGLVGYHLPGAGTLLLGDSVLGPAGLVDASAGGAHVAAAAVRTPDGQMLTSAQAAVQVGPVSVGYATGPGGGSPTLQYQHGPLSFSAAAPPGQGVQVGVGVSLGQGARVDGAWAADGSWRAQLALPLGPDGGGPKAAACMR